MGASGDKLLCPVKSLQHIMQARKLLKCETDRHLCASLTSQTVIKRIKDTARRIGVPASNYSSHSIRIGGATALAAGGADKLSIKFLGRWLSNCYEEYPRHAASTSKGLSKKMVQRLYLQGGETLEGDETPESEGRAAVAEFASERSKKKRASSKKKKPSARDHHVARSVAKNVGGVTNKAAQPQEPGRDIVNSVTEHNPKKYQEDMPSKLKGKWLAAMVEELQALEDNGVLESRAQARGYRTKWVYKTKMNAQGAIERLKARLVACGNEQDFGVDYSVTRRLRQRK
ncbi:hypothetical protein PR003_g13414 [Phytophthora rubi]|uniref:Tyr recombinase domain-containing protein n=1 Tax=Phytophthora rubi TaxID=129364 RepID=A0A6A3LJV7_9STRA|nr:hypothetical protein PR001_g14739 [Phytophthora rubi]KAE9334653.1 hypothetical protein PR003_g13414 [Phytophthora rubi]